MGTWVDRLKREYATGKKYLIAYRLTLDTTNPTESEESTVVGGMISDMQFAMECMRRGRSPGSRRGAEQLEVYQRTELATMFPSIVPDADDLTNDEKRRILDILIGLSSRERQCFLLYVTKGLTQIEIADKLKVSRTSVQKYVERARDKVQQWI